MAKKVKAYARGGKVKGAPKAKRKSKLPTLGGSLTGLAGTGAQGTIP
jgi:hypothetical protein